MKISNNWLKDFVKTESKTERIGEFLTDIGLEVEGIDKFESVKGSLEGIVSTVVLNLPGRLGSAHWKSNSGRGSP